jgi:A/G-specific adenine glycosylase
MKKEKLTEIIQPLLEWFADHARELPWRALYDGTGAVIAADQRSYRIWVSEIMLQQTRVEAVRPYYQRFMEALPDLVSLAGCPEERLLKLWEGLGYYNRVRNMQKAALQVMEQYGGCLPHHYEELLSLPGIGSYTAGAIASIAYGERVPAVDGNVLRVLSRICGSEEDIARPSVKTMFERELRSVMEDVFRQTAQEKTEMDAGISGGGLPGAFNQALMELGAIVCLPNGQPACERCPVQTICCAYAEGRQMELPVKSSKKARRTEQRTVLVVRDSGHGLVRRRAAKGLLAGLYELPNLDGHLAQETVLEQVKDWGFSPIRITPLPAAKHIFSHIEWQMTGYMVLVEDQDAIIPEKTEPGQLLFVEPERTERDYPIPAAFAAYTKYLSIRLGQEKYQTMEEI